MTNNGKVIKPTHDGAEEIVNTAYALLTKKYGVTSQIGVTLEVANTMANDTQLMALVKGKTEVWVFPQKDILVMGADFSRTPNLDMEKIFSGIIISQCFEKVRTKSGIKVKLLAKATMSQRVYAELVTNYREEMKAVNSRSRKNIPSVMMVLGNKEMTYVEYVTTTKALPLTLLEELSYFEDEEDAMKHTPEECLSILAKEFGIYPGYIHKIPENKPAYYEYINDTLVNFLNEQKPDYMRSTFHELEDWDQNEYGEPANIKPDSVLIYSKENHNKALSVKELDKEIMPEIMKYVLFGE